MAFETIKTLENKIHPKMRLNAICPYFTMFPLIFPYTVLKSANEGDLIYDPFCGRGTTNYAARLHGLNSFGVDSNPVAHAIAQAKLIHVKPKEILNLCQDVLRNLNITTIPNNDFWNLAYHESTLVEICTLRDYFLQSIHKPTKAEIALKAIILGILHGPIMKSQPSYLSNQMPRTFATKPDYSVNYWRARNMEPNYVNTVQLIQRKAEYVFNKQMPERVSGKIILGDSREIKSIDSKKFDWVVTSPPYYGMSTYEQDQWLRNWFLGGTEKVDYSRGNQLSHWSEAAFVKDLGRVWKNTAKKCKPQTKLIIRFGALPSKSEKTPSQLIKESIQSSDCGWKIRTIHKAGEPMDSRRQANQFQTATGKYIEEIDVFAILDI